jgi:EmrB/QacA subfamily drug resistance transporter
MSTKQIRACLCRSTSQVRWWARPTQGWVSSANPWRALAALCLGFFMVLLDMTIVSVANPVIMTDLDADISSVVWVTSAYLLAYAVPVLTTGRLGDHHGAKNIYLSGLVVFTVASLGCALATNIHILIAARVVQGLGAALMTPQTLAIITRVFPPDRRGTALGVWGSIAGVSALAGPIAGGILIANFGWESIFMLNVPVGVVAFLLAARFIPVLPTNEHRFDVVGMLLSGIALFCIVFGLQEGNAHDWSVGVWLTLAIGVVVCLALVWEQSHIDNEPLVPLDLFKDRNFSLANIAIAAMAFSITAMVLEAMFYAQLVRGFSPTTAAIVFAPLALVTAALAPAIGRSVDRLHPRYIPAIGFFTFAVAQGAFAAVMTPDTEIWKYMFPIVLMGVANACIWAPLSATATHNLPSDRAGAGAGIYNTTRLIGSVLGSAAMAAVVASRMSARGIANGLIDGSAGRLPPDLRAAFNSVLAESMMLPACVLLVGLAAAAMFVRPVSNQNCREQVGDAVAAG